MSREKYNSTFTTFKCYRELFLENVSTFSFLSAESAFRSSTWDSNSNNLQSVASRIVKVLFHGQVPQPVILPLDRVSRLSPTYSLSLSFSLDLLETCLFIFFILFLEVSRYDNWVAKQLFPLSKKKTKKQKEEPKESCRIICRIL